MRRNVSRLPRIGVCYHPPRDYYKNQCINSEIVRINLILSGKRGNLAARSVPISVLDFITIILQENSHKKRRNTFLLEYNRRLCV
jgi:lipoprotein signal peptidase